MKNKDPNVEEFPASQTEPHDCVCGHEWFAHFQGEGCLSEDCSCKAFRGDFHSDPIAMRGPRPKVGRR
jgi:hypothetical protein